MPEPGKIYGPAGMSDALSFEPYTRHHRAFFSGKLTLSSDGLDDTPSIFVLHRLYKRFLGFTGELRGREEIIDLHTECSRSNRNKIMHAFFVTRNASEIVEGPFCDEGLRSCGIPQSDISAAHCFQDEYRSPMKGGSPSRFNMSSIIENFEH